MHPPSAKMEWTPWLLALSVVCCCLVSSSRAFQAPGRPRPTRATRQLTRGTCTSTTQQQPRPLGDECHLSHRRRRRTRLRSTTEDRESTGAASGKQKAKWGQRTDADVSRYLADFIGPDGDLIDPYKLLGVRRKASPSDIKASYRRLSRKLHPDAVARSEILPGRCRNMEDVRGEWERVKFSYEILIDPKRRKNYDRNSKVTEVMEDPGGAAARAIGGAAWDGLGMMMGGVWKLGEMAVKTATVAEDDDYVMRQAQQPAPSTRSEDATEERTAATRTMGSNANGAEVGDDNLDLEARKNASLELFRSLQAQQQQNAASAALGSTSPEAVSGSGGDSVIEEKAAPASVSGDTGTVIGDGLSNRARGSPGSQERARFNVGERAGTTAVDKATGAKMKIITPDMPSPGTKRKENSNANVRRRRVGGGRGFGKK